MSHRPLLTIRAAATEDRTVLRRLVAASVEQGAAEEGRGVSGWLDDVQRLVRTVTSLSAARRAGASEDVVAALRERVSIAMILVMPVYRSSSAKLQTVLSVPGAEGLLDLWRSEGQAVTGPVDPWLHRPVTDTVQDALAARISPLRLERVA